MAYPPVAYGLAFINLGLTFYMDAGKDYGTDPRGFIGWENETKTVFFAGVITKSAVSQIRPSRQRGCGGSSLFSYSLLSRLSFPEIKYFHDFHGTMASKHILSLMSLKSGMKG